MELYENIRKRREELGMSQDELAKLMGYKSRASINKIEMGKADIPQSKIAQFARALNISPGELMGWVPATQKSHHELKSFSGATAHFGYIVENFMHSLSEEVNDETRKKLPILTEGRDEKDLVLRFRSMNKKDKNTLLTLAHSLSSDKE